MYDGTSACRPQSPQTQIASSHTESCLALPSTQHAPGHRQKEQHRLLESEIGHVCSPCLQRVNSNMKKKRSVWSFCHHKKIQDDKNWDKQAETDESGVKPLKKRDVSDYAWHFSFSICNISPPQAWISQLSVAIE